MYDFFQHVCLQMRSAGGDGGGMDVVAQAICATTRQFAFASPATYLAWNKFTSPAFVSDNCAEDLHSTLAYDDDDEAGE